MYKYFDGHLTFLQIKEFYTIMNRITLLAVSFVFAAVFAVSTFAQTPTATKIGWLDTGAFGDEKEGVTRYIAGLKALDSEMKPKVLELQTIQAKLKTISEELTRAQNSPSNVPIDQKAIQAKQEEGQKLQTDFEYAKKKYDAALEARSGQVLGPISADISKAIQDFAKAKGYAVVLDINALAQANAILSLDTSANITKEFITFYNTRPASTATTAAPK